MAECARVFTLTLSEREAEILRTLLDENTEEVEDDDPGQVLVGIFNALDWEMRDE